MVTSAEDYALSTSPGTIRVEVLARLASQVEDEVRIAIPIRWVGYEHP
jgi:hypothetical protein